MKKLTPEEKAAYTTRPMQKQGIVRTMLMNMKLNDIILIEEHEWKWKSATPAYLCRRVEEKTKWKFECEKAIAPQKGWLITRIK